MRPLIIYLVAMAGLHLLELRRARKQKHHQLTSACPTPVVESHEIVIDGKRLGITEDELNRILIKRFPYYARLHPDLQSVFLRKLIEFIETKIFIIKDNKGFKEMPVLVSATAIQLCFGLKDHLLPFFRYIRIHPKEYMAETELKILAGNVKGNIITVAWNHFLDGIEDAYDGSNLGLHEMSHALYFQKLVIEGNYAKRFSTKYQKLINLCALAHEDEAKSIRDVYSDYALTNLQEFWAESVELFFEKPQMLHDNYPDIFMSMKLLLNQNPLHHAQPLISGTIGFDEKLKRIAGTIAARLNSFRV